MRGVDIQRAKQDKSSLSLQTVECCDINEMITQLNCYNTTTKTFMTTKLLKKLNGNIVSIHTFPNIITNQNKSMSTDLNSTKLSNNNQISHIKITSSYNNNNENAVTATTTTTNTPATNNNNNYFTSNANNNYYTNIKTVSNSNYKTFPKFVQNIDSIGFDKPNWKPILLNEKSSSQQSMTNLNNNQNAGGSNSNQSSRLKSRRGTRNTNTNNGGTYLQKPQSHSQLDMYLNSDTHKQKINEMTQKHRNENSNLTNDALLQRKKKLFLKSSNLNLKTTTNLQQKCRSTTSQSNDSTSEDSNVETNPITLPLIKSTTFYNEKPHESTFRSSAEPTTIQKIPKITDSKISFYDTDLTEALNISKISPSNKYQLYSSTENDLLLEKSQYSNNVDAEISFISHDNQTPYVQQVPLESGGQELLDANNNLFINNVMKSKQELDAYLSSLKNNDPPVNEMYPPPNSPTITQVQPKVMKVKSPASEQRSVSTLKNSYLLPNRLQKLESNSQKKKLDGSINMVKVNKNILNSTADSNKLPVVSSVNDKLYVDIFVPSGV